jgi:HAE1 family hydrophobic/amphiphilic exporter-1
MIAYMVRHPNAANLLMAAIIVLGILALPSLTRATFPELTNDKVQIQIPYRGATAEEVEDAVCRRVENAIEGVTGLIETICEAREGRSVTLATMREDGEMMRFLADIKSEIDAINDFPADVEDRVVNEIGRTEFVISLAVTGPARATDLKDYAEHLKGRLQALGPIARVTLRGFSDRQIRIEVPVSALRQFALSAVDVANAVRAQNVGVPAGLVEGPEEDVILRFDDQRKRLDDFRGIPVISATTGAQIRLGDIATITDRFEKPEQRVVFNGRRAAMLDIYKSKADDVLTVVDSVKAFVAAEQKRMPDTLSLVLTRDSASIVRDRLDVLLANGLQGLVLVFIVLGLFFSLRYSFWVAMGLPVSFLGTLFVMSQIGMSVNMITMVGLLIAIGLLMDDPIVISENIAVRMARGENPKDAAINGAREVLPGILSSFATTVLIFGALAFLKGDLGQILRVLPVVLIVTLAVSLIEAFLILPHHLSHALGNAQHGPSKFRAAFDRGFDWFRDRLFGRLLDIAIAWRYLTVGLVVALLMVSVAMLAGGILKVRGFPEIDGDIIEARILLPQGTPLKRTEEVVAGMVGQLKVVNGEFKSRQPDKANLIHNIAEIYSSNVDAYETGPHVVTISVDLLSAEIRDGGIDEILNRWRELVGNLPDVIAISFTEPALGPAGRAIELRLSGSDLTQLKRASIETQAWLNRFAGVVDLNDDLRPGKREIRLHLREGAGALGMTARSIADQVRVAFQGIEVDTFPLGAETFEVNLRVSAHDRRTARDLETLTLIGPDGALIPLSNVAALEEVRGWARINRIDGRRTVSLLGGVDTKITNTAEIIGALNAQFIPGLIERNPGLGMVIKGESANTGETRGSMGRNMIYGLIGVYLLLAFLFGGYFTPLLVMAVIPTALIGVIWGHLALGLEISMPSLIGAASLAGVVVNNSILMLQFIRKARAEGDNAAAAAATAGRARLRAIVLTSLTTVMGLLPLLLEKSLQAQILIPLATSLAFGLAVSTLLTLFLTPSLYCILDDFGATARFGKRSG